MSQEALFITASQTLPEVSSVDLVNIKPPYTHMRRQPKEFILYFILSGEMYLTEGQREYTLKENDLILLSPDCEHYGRRSSECRFYYIHFTMADLACQETETALLRETLLRERRRAQQAPVRADGKRHPKLPSDSDSLRRRIYLPKYMRFDTPQASSTIIPRLKRAFEAFEGHRHYHHLETACILYELFLEISRDYTRRILYAENASPGSTMAAVEDMLSYFNRCYMGEITGNGLSERYHRNFDYLNRRFKEATGQTILAYVNGLRIEKAKQLLRDHYYSVTEIAEKTGFHDIYYFSRVFKKFTGTAPSRYADD